MHASAGWYGDHTVDTTSEGVTVRKGLDLDTLALPALKFEIRSERDHPVGVRVVDTLPSTMNPSRIGLHADFAADQWTAFDDGRITFTTRLDPDRPVVTLYGVWLDDPSRIHELFGVPDLKVVSDPDAPSLAPVGDEVELPTVDNSLRSVGPDALEDLRNDVERALTEVRAEPADSPTELPAGNGTGTSDADDPSGTMGDHAWTYPVERQGTGRIAAPTHADLEDLVDGDVGENHIYVRSALTETHHGGGGAILLQELANAFEIVARKVTGDSERATVDAVIKTPLGTEAVLHALAGREQVSDALVSPLVGDPGDATGIDATPESDTETADREDTEEVSVEPDAEDVEVVLNAEGERFAELQEEFEHETDTDKLEDELTSLELPGLDLADEPTIDELVDGDSTVDLDDSGFVPANVKATRDEDYELDLSDADSAADWDESDDTGEETTALDFSPDTESTIATADTFSFEDAVADVTDDEDAVADVTDDEDAVADVTDEEAAVGDGADDEHPETAAVETADAPGGAGDEPPEPSDPGDAHSSGGREPSPAADSSQGSSGEKTVEVPAAELEAVQAELRSLRDRVATLETELEAVRAEDGAATGGHPVPQPIEDGGEGPASDASGSSNGTGAARTNGDAGTPSNGTESGSADAFESGDHAVEPGDLALDMFEPPEPVHEDAE